MDLLMTAAILPAVVLLWYVYKKDPVEKEPMDLLIRLLFLGMLSVIPAIVLELLGTNLFLAGWEGSYEGYLLVDNFVVVAVVEEGCKYMFLRGKAWRHPAFDYAFDGIVYAVFVGLGFAIAENIMYVMEYGLGTAFVRAFTAIPGHAVFAVFMGYFFGAAKYASVHGHHFTSVLCTFAALVIPMLCHGTYDLLATLESDAALALFFAFLIGMVAAGMHLVNRESQAARHL